MSSMWNLVSTTFKLILNLNIKLNMKLRIEIHIDFSGRVYTKLNRKDILKK